MITKKKGIEVHFRRPKKLVYQVETEDRRLAVRIAVDRAKSTYPNLDWDNPIAMTTEFTYNEVRWED